MVTTTIAAIAEVLAEVNKLANFVKEISEKIDSFYPLEEDDFEFDDDLVVSSDVDSEDEEDIYNTCRQYHSIEEDGPA